MVVNKKKTFFWKTCDYVPDATYQKDSKNGWFLRELEPVLFQINTEVLRRNQFVCITQDKQSTLKWIDFSMFSTFHESCKTLYYYF